MANTEQLPDAVLRRKAVVYVRQSTQSQVQNNLESKRRQYDLVEEARRRGFAQIEVIDDDLGKSASGTVARPGFDRLVAWLCAGEVGAVLCFDASRLTPWCLLCDPCDCLHGVHHLLLVRTIKGPHASGQILACRHCRRKDGVRRTITEHQCEPPLQPRPPLRWPGALTPHQRSLIELMLVPQTSEIAQQLLDELAIALAVPGRIRTTPMRWIAGLMRRHARGEFVPTVEATSAHKVNERRVEPAEVRPPLGVAPSERVREQLKAVAERLRIRPS